MVWTSLMLYLNLLTHVVWKYNIFFLMIAVSWSYHYTIFLAHHTKLHTSKWMNIVSYFEDKLQNRSTLKYVVFNYCQNLLYTCCTMATMIKRRELLESTHSGRCTVTSMLLFLSRLTHYLFISAGQGVCVLDHWFPTLVLKYPFCVYFVLVFSSATSHLTLLLPD